MRKLLVLFCMLVFSVMPVLAQEMKLLAKFPNTGFYYYSMENFNIDAFNKPDEVKPANFMYHIFLYDKNIPQVNFNHRDRYDIEDDYGYLFDMIRVGIENKPIAYIHRTQNENNEVKVTACEFRSNNEQVKYIFNKESGKFIKQITFNNGELGIGNICNPDYVPGQDI